MKGRALFEARWILAAVVAAWFLALLLVPWLSVIFAALLLFVLYFFRDPERQPPADESLIVSAADGTVVAVEEVEENEFVNARMLRISIFLSVFDVHVNRAPIAGEITHSEPKPGKFLDARNPACSDLNESRTWVFAGANGLQVIVKQITGAIARRIVPWSQVGDTVARGERFGMIRFGSRTEIYLPLNVEILVKSGDKVKGTETPVARLK